MVVRCGRVCAAVGACVFVRCIRDAGRALGAALIAGDGCTAVIMARIPAE